MLCAAVRRSGDRQRIGPKKTGTRTARGTRQIGNASVQVSRHVQVQAHRDRQHMARATRGNANLVHEIESVNDDSVTMTLSL